MAKQTLLEMVQNILSAMDSDEVNSISDTVESLQVATIVKETYDDIAATLKIPERQFLFHLDSPSNDLYANYLTIPSAVKNINWLKYNGLDVVYVDPEYFMSQVLRYTDNIRTVTDRATGVTYQVGKDSDPKFYTSFDDKSLAFNSFNAAAESTLQGINSLCYGEKTTSFVLDDATIPDLDDDWFPTLLAEAKTSCFVNLKQVSNSKEETRARRGLVRIQNELSKANRSPMDRLPDYSRRR